MLAVRYLLPLVALLWTLLLSGCPGCRPAEATLAGQERATAIVWESRYGMTAPPPHVAWRLQAALDCHPDPFKNAGFTLDGIGCVGGAYWGLSRVAEVALPDGRPISGTSFAHELWHAALHELGDATGDPEHLGDGWRAGGEVELANADLRAAGL